MQKSRKILLVDDSELMIHFLVEVLKSYDLTIVTALNGFEAIEKTFQEIPDVILIDDDMAEVSGFQVTRFIKSYEGFKDIPIIIHSMYADERNRHWALSCGADDICVKGDENSALLIQLLLSKADHPPYSQEKMMRDRGLKLDRVALMSAMVELIDRQLSQALVLNRLITINTHLDSIEKTVKGILEIILDVGECPIAMFILKKGRKALKMALPKAQIFQNDLNDFTGVSLTDFYHHFPDLRLENLDEVLFNVEERHDFQTERLAKEKMNH